MQPCRGGVPLELRLQLRQLGLALGCPLVEGRQGHGVHWGSGADEQIGSIALAHSGPAQAQPACVLGGASHQGACACAGVHASVRACVCACMLVCMHACARTCTHAPRAAACLVAACALCNSSAAAHPSHACMRMLLTTMSVAHAHPSMHAPLLCGHAHARPLAVHALTGQ